MTTLAACVIAYNAERKIGELLESLKPQVDHIVVGIDPKTTDRTRAVCEKYKAIIYDGIDPWLSPPDELPEWMEDVTPREREGMVRAHSHWGFAGARNLSFAHVPRGTDWILWIDTDDVLKADVPLRDICKQAPPQISGIVLPYVYFRDEYGNVTTIFDRERLLRASHGPFWVAPLHETCQLRNMGEWWRTYQNVEQAPAWIEHKNRDEQDKGGRNFTILRRWLEIEPTSSRAMWYLAMQHFAGNEYANAAEWFERAVQARPGTNLESWQGLVYQAKAYKNLGRNDKAIESSARAMMMIPDLADPYFDMAHAYQGEQQWLRAIWYHEEGLKKNRPSGPIMVNPLDYEFNPFVIIHTSYRMLGRTEEALANLEKALAVRPRDPELNQVAGIYRWELSRARAISGGLDLVQHLAANAEPTKAETVISCLPAGTGEDPKVREIAAAVAQPTLHLRNEAAYENFYFSQQEPKSEPNLRHRWILKRARQRARELGRAPSDVRVLWCGVGDASGPFLLASEGFRVVALDADPRRVKLGNLAAVKNGYMKKRYSREHGRSLPRITRNGKPDPDLGIQFHYSHAHRPPVSESVRSLAPFDLVVAGSLLTRVPSPQGLFTTLESLGSPVIHTLRDGLFPISEEQRRGLVRTWSRSEMEGLLMNRGRLVESHVLSDEAPGLLCFEYTPGENWNTPEHPTVTIYCGPGWEDWTPDQIDAKGLGGSETAVVRLAAVLARRGMRVTVYGPVDGVWDGVVYRHWSKYNPRTPRWMFVSWRNPGIFESEVAAEYKVLWVHDTDYRERVTEENMASVDTVWCLSDWHRQHLSEVYPFLREKLVVVGNGIDPERFAGREERQPSRIVYSSSPDRGLEQALLYWPQIREVIPDAELHVFYDWTNFDLMRGPGDYKAKVQALAQQPGVIWRGRVGQQELAREFMRASVLLYPGPHPFCETFCITAVEAQAAGCVPVTRDNGALPETNACGIRVANDAHANEWVTAIQEARARSEDERTKMRLWAIAQTWDVVADRLIAGAIAAQTDLPAPVETAGA